MKSPIKIAVTYMGAECTIKVDSTDENTTGKISYAGGPVATKEVQKIVQSSYGSRGKLIGDSARPIDLYVALFATKSLKDMLAPRMVDDDPSRWKLKKVPSGLID